MLKGIKNFYREKQKNNEVNDISFKKTHSFEKRKNESDRVLAKYPNRIPIICERLTMNVPKIDRMKYLCPDDLSISSFMFVIRKRLKLEPEKALYLFINSKIVPCSKLLADVYEKEKNEDGFLYINYAGESTFG
tara:strand:+ start:73 stop:474 length:402 start_codon:yes stop_codon:yes gene_type:complete